MYDTSRDRTAMPEHAKEEDSGLASVQGALVAAGGDPNDELRAAAGDRRLLVRGARPGGDGQLQGIPAAEGGMGGDEAFLKGILRHFGTFQVRGPPALSYATRFAPSPTGLLTRGTPSRP